MSDINISVDKHTLNHKLITPLSGILSNVKLLSQKNLKLSLEQRAWLNDIAVCSEELLKFTKYLLNQLQNEKVLYPFQFAKSQEERVRGKRLYVLLVEDNLVVQRAHTQILESLNCMVDVANNGYEALSLVDEKYDLILMDIQMPGIDGIETAIKIHTKKEIKKIPIIGITADYSNDLDEQCLQEGFKILIKKPLEINVITEIMQDLIKNKEITYSLMDMTDIVQNNTLAIHLIAFLGNQAPNQKQLELMESLLLTVGVNLTIIFDRKLTKREIECLRLTALGNSSSSTAEILRISKKTVEHHRNEIKRKLNCKSISQAIFHGLKFGYLHQ